MTTTDKETMDRKAKGRRAFLKLAGVGAATGGAAAVLGGAAAEAAAPQGEAGKAGYRETEHVKKFYETARF